MVRRILVWTAACAVGEGLGLTLSAAVAALAVPLVAPGNEAPDAAVQHALMIGAGAIEGACLGAVQAAGLRRWIGRVSFGGWVAASAVGMAISWAIGTAIGGDIGGEGLGDIVAFASVSGLAIGVIQGTGQALVLYRHVRRGRAWLIGSALGWPPAMLATSFGAALVPADAYGPLAFGLLFVTGACAGALVGLATGLALALSE